MKSNSTTLLHPIQGFLLAQPSVPRGTELAPKLEKYVQLVLKWNQQINLTGAKTEQEFFQDHVADSLLASQAFLDTKPEQSLWLDVGSGSGIPGMVWGLLKPAQEILLVESIQKKAAFLQRAANLLETPEVSISSKRFETLKVEEVSKAPTKICVSRGTASPEALMELMLQSKIPIDSWYVFSTPKTHEEFEKLITQPKYQRFSISRIDCGENPFLKRQVLLSRLQSLRKKP